MAPLDITLLSMAAAVAVCSFVFRASLHFFVSGIQKKKLSQKRKKITGTLNQLHSNTYDAAKVHPPVPQNAKKGLQLPQQGHDFASKEHLLH